MIQIKCKLLFHSVEIHKSHYHVCVKQQVIREAIGKINKIRKVRRLFCERFSLRIIHKQTSQEKILLIAKY